MSDEERRAFSNLFIVCGNCHDEIDDKDNGDDFPAEMLRKIKEEHESVFVKAERKFISKYSDSTQLNDPKFPTHLQSLADALCVSELIGAKDEIEGIGSFIENLAETPYSERDFALQIAQRMLRKGVDELPVEDVVSAFEMTPHALKETMRVLEHHQIGDIDDKWGDDTWTVQLRPRDPDGNPWFELIEFCKVQKLDPTGIIRSLDFSVYD